jgi:hypothetical protein
MELALALLFIQANSEAYSLSLLAQSSSSSVDSKNCKVLDMMLQVSLLYNGDGVKYSNELATWR